MPHLHLPAEHDDDDLALAGALAAALQSADLYVTWSTSKGAPARPVIAAPCGRRRRRLRGLFRKPAKG